MTVVTLLFSCCRGRRRRRVEDEPDTPDEESRLIPPVVEPEQPSAPEAADEERERKRARLGKIVRAKEVNMINTFSPAPFNVLNQPNRYSPQRFGLGGRSSSSLSLSRSGSRNPPRSLSAARYDRNYLSQGYGYGAVGIGFNPTLIHTMTSKPAPLEPESSEVQVQIEGTRATTLSSERKTSSSEDVARGRVASGQSDAPDSGTGTKNTSDSQPQRPANKVFVASPSPITKSASSSSDLSPSNPGSGDVRATGTTSGLGVRLVHPLPSRGRGRRQVKADVGSASPIGSSKSPHTGPSSPGITSPPPPSPHSDNSPLSSSSDLPLANHTPISNPNPNHNLLPTFVIHDVGDVTVGWDSD
ncbi:hypothetical protein GYMLUDRAFT_49923 [Collybiopsis luxurians FD-317 M1]|uniref:Uncharacterized protein n=1 Tax=Collybiopsis luxurians FD-317 M1 TaxID=944289 RepID=A0A0D0AQ47_9AGAR|nr:hypothetical protein GYMLUDRAFT_49923 [Collybiopsis luxurians FD-317 M1]